VGSSKRDLLEFPEAVKDGIGTALSVAQFGGKHPAAKPWKGQGTGVLEVVHDYDTVTRTGPFISSDFGALSMCCIVFRRSLTEVFKRRGGTWNSYRSA